MFNSPNKKRPALPAPSAFDENVTSIFIGVISASHSKAKQCQSKAKAKPKQSQLRYYYTIKRLALLYPTIFGDSKAFLYPFLINYCDKHITTKHYYNNLS